MLPLAVGIGTTVCTILIHGMVLGTIVRLVRHDLRVGRAGISFWTDLLIVTGVALFALAAHLIEIAVWAMVLTRCGEFSDLAAAFYHSAVNYTSLGYGDIVMSPSWKLLGPLETADGMLMFGVSTAMVFAVIQRFIQTRFAAQG